VDALRFQYMRADHLNNRIKCNNTGADPIGERRCVDLHTFPRIGGTLPVQRLMHQELRDQHHGKQARASEATRDRMRWRAGGSVIASQSGRRTFPAHAR
jgi:hypothetical protein